MLDFPGPGVKPMSSVLAGGFLSSVPPGKSSVPLYLLFYFLALPHGLHDLVPQPGIKHEPPAPEAWSLNRWTPREVAGASLKMVFHYGLLGCSFFPWTSWGFLLWCLALQGASWCFTQSLPLSHALCQNSSISSRWAQSLQEPTVPSSFRPIWHILSFVLGITSGSLCYFFICCLERFV